MVCLPSKRERERERERERDYLLSLRRPVTPRGQSP